MGLTAALRWLHLGATSQSAHTEVKDGSKREYERQPVWGNVFKQVTKESDLEQFKMTLVAVVSVQMLMGGEISALLLIENSDVFFCTL